MQVEIFRVESGKQGTYGVLTIEGKFFCITLEPENLNNLPDLSCIPAGTYHCIGKLSEKFGLCFEVLGVPNRTGILFHYGNVLADTHGCILLGVEYNPLNRKILKSLNAWGYFKTIVGEDFTLTIKNLFA